jgi:hypothetical protein
MERAAAAEAVQVPVERTPVATGHAVTVRVGAATRDRINALALQLNTTADGAILAALRLVERDARREQARLDALRLRDDPADRAEMEAVRRDMAAWNAGE